MSSPEENAALRQKIIQAIKHSQVKSYQDLLKKFKVNKNWLANHRSNHPAFREALTDLKKGCVTGKEKQELLAKAVKLVKSGKIKARKQLTNELGVSVNWVPNTMATYPEFRKAMEQAGLAGLDPAGEMRAAINQAIEADEVASVKEVCARFGITKTFISNNRHPARGYDDFVAATNKIMFTDRCTPEDNIKAVDTFLKAFKRTGSKLAALKTVKRNNQWFRNAIHNNVNNMKPRWEKLCGDTEEDALLYIISTSPLMTRTSFGITTRDLETRLNSYNASQDYISVFRVAWEMKKPQAKEYEKALKKISGRREQFACSPQELYAFMLKEFNLGKPVVYDMKTKVKVRTGLAKLPKR